MRALRSSLIVAAICLMSSCSFMYKPFAAPIKPSDVGYVGGDEVTFYYAQAIKAARLYNDTLFAKKLLQKGLEIDSLHAPSLFLLATIALETDVKQAEYYVKKAAEIDPENVWYQTILGRTMIANGQYEEATNLYVSLIKKDRPNSDNYRILAALYDQNNQPFIAIMVLDSAETRLGRREEISSFKSELLMKVKLFDRAVDETQKLINNNPYDENNYLTIARIYASMGKDSLAIANFNTARNINPSNMDVALAMRDFFGSRNDIPNFIAATKQLFLSDIISKEYKVKLFEEIKENEELYRNYFFSINDLVSTLLIKYPNDYDVIELYASHLILSGGINEALAQYKSYIVNNTPTLDAFTNILNIEAYLKRPDSVKHYATMALELFPQSYELYIRNGSILDYFEQPKKALKLYKKALRYAPSDSARSLVYGILGDIEHVKNKSKKCYRYYDKALKIYPNNSLVLNNYAYFLATEGVQLEKALEMTKLSNELSPTNPTSLDTYAWVLFKMGRYQEAKKIMQLAFSLDKSNSVELALHYGDILNALGEEFMAKFYWDKALERGADKEAVESRKRGETPKQ